MKKHVVVGMCLALCVLGAQAMQKNGEVWYDTAGHAVNAHGGGVLEHGGKYYLYGEHKVYGRAGNKAHVGVHIYSSDDLEKWKDEGIALKVEDKPGHDIEDGCVLERPKILFCDKTGKFVMFFHLELKGQGYSAARVGIAVADKATGPYQFLRSLRPNAGQWPMNVPERERVEETKAKYMTAGKKAKLWGAHFDGGQMSRDMTLFKDDDGKAWHIFSSEDNSTLHIAELTDDYLDYTGRWWRAAELDWTEAAAVCKKDGWYFLIGSGCTGWKPNTARCYRAKSITGPWERLGNPCKGVNPANGLGPDLTWGGQSNYILKKDDGEYVAMFDIWKPDNQIDSRLVWLPIDFNADGTISIEWADDALVLPNGRRITRSMITGHRGDARSLPENTLMAFRRAVDNGFCFECDFYMTNDGEVYCVHDMNLKRTFGIAGLATNVCWKGTLDKVDVGAIKGPQFAGRADCRVPRIDEVFALIPDDGRKITLEVKDPRPEIVPLIQAAWRRHPNMKEENIIFLAHKATRAALVKAFPRATFQHCVNCYSDGWRKGCTPIPVARQLAELDARPECRNFSPMFDLDLLTPDYISAVHGRGVMFYTWCVDRPEDAVEAFGRGVDGICSNCPVELWEGLKAICGGAAARGGTCQRDVKMVNLRPCETTYKKEK